MGRYSIFGRLFAEPSFVEGFARVVDIGATLQVYNTSSTEKLADTEALRNDWWAVGDDMRSAIGTYEQEQAVARSA